MPYKIREYRLQKNLTQAELAKRAKLSRATISALENGVMAVTTTDTLIKLADALGKKVSDIFLP